jgi:hypothetical protein
VFVVAMNCSARTAAAPVEQISSVTTVRMKRMSRSKRFTRAGARPHTTNHASTPASRFIMPTESNVMVAAGGRTSTRKSGIPMSYGCTPIVISATAMPTKMTPMLAISILLASVRNGIGLCVKYRLDAMSSWVDSAMSNVLNQFAPLAASREPRCPSTP